MKFIQIKLKFELKKTDFALNKYNFGKYYCKIKIDETRSVFPETYEW